MESIALSFNDLSSSNFISFCCFQNILITILSFSSLSLSLSLFQSPHQVFDWDRVGADDFIGETSIDVLSLDKTEEISLSLQSKKTSKNPHRESKSHLPSLPLLPPEPLKICGDSPSDRSIASFPSFPPSPPRPLRSSCDATPPKSRTVPSVTSSGTYE